MLPAGRWRTRRARRRRRPDALRRLLARGHPVARCRVTAAPRRRVAIVTKGPTPYDSTRRAPRRRRGRRARGAAERLSYAADRIAASASSPPPEGCVRPFDLENHWLLADRFVEVTRRRRRSPSSERAAGAPHTRSPLIRPSRWGVEGPIPDLAGAGGDTRSWPHTSRRPRSIGSCWPGRAALDPSPPPYPPDACAASPQLAEIWTRPDVSLWRALHLRRPPELGSRHSFALLARASSSDFRHVV